MDYSIVIPVYNEEESLHELYSRLCNLIKKLDGPTEIIFVDDGSSDNSYAIMLGICSINKNFKLIHLSRNFGHQIAITAGMDLSQGDAVVIMDADLQDPPEVILEMTKKWREGFEVVYAVRSDRDGESWFKKLSAKIYYRLLKSLADTEIPIDVGDFRLVSRQALQAFNALREHNRYIRGMFSWIGFRQTGIEYHRSRRYAGNTKYPLKRMVKLAFDGIISFSVKPLRVVLKLGFLVAFLSLVGSITAVILKMTDAYVVPGWTSIIFIILLLNGIQLIVTGIMGEYLGRITDEVRNRPLYIISHMEGFGSDFISVERAVIENQSFIYRRKKLNEI